MLVYEFRDDEYQLRDDGSGSKPISHAGEYGLIKVDNKTIQANMGILTCVTKPNLFQTQVEYIIPGDYLFKVPNNVEWIKVLAIGGGTNGYKYTKGATSTYCGYAGASGAISALLQVTPGETIPLTVGKNGDGVWLYDGRIGDMGAKSKSHGFTAYDMGGDAVFGDFIIAKRSSSYKQTNWRDRPDSVFKPRRKGDSIINGFAWDSTVTTGRTKYYKIPKSITTQMLLYNTPTDSTTDYVNCWYYRTLKAACDGYREKYVPSDNTNNLPYNSPSGSTTGVHCWQVGGTMKNGNVSNKGGTVYGLFGLGGTGANGARGSGNTTLNGASGGDACNFGGIGGYGGAAPYASGYCGDTGRSGPGGIFIWY